MNGWVNSATHLLGIFMNFKHLSLFDLVYIYIYICVCDYNSNFMSSKHKSSTTEEGRSHD